MMDANDGTLWQTATVVCVICLRRWQATFPIEVPALECPACGYMNKVPEL